MYSPDDYRLPERPLEPPASSLPECEDCGDVILHGEYVIVWDGQRICECCACERTREAMDMGAFWRLIDRLQEEFCFSVFANEEET